MEHSISFKAISLAPYNAIFLAGSILVYAVVYWGVPLLGNLGVEPMVGWMLLSILFIFTPVIAWGCLLLRRESGTQSLAERLWLRRPSKADWLWSALGLLGIVVGSSLMFWLCTLLGLETNPPFFRNLEPLTENRLWILGLWALYWPINILSEDLVWRGIALPQMEKRLGARAWLLNALLWGVFHLAFGLGNLLVLLPTLLLVPFIAQRRRNTWLAVLLHAGLSGPSFLALAFGLIR